MKKLFLKLTLILFVIPFGISQDLPSYVPTNGLVAYYPFNGNANDESGNGYHGDLGGATLTNDRYNDGNAYYLDRNQSPITLPKEIFNFQQSDDFSISFWFTDDGSVNNNRLLSTESPEGNLRITKYNDNIAIQFGDYIEITEILSDWNHIVYTNSNKNEVVYLNGQLIYSGSDTASENMSYNHPFTIGVKASNPNNSQDQWKGGFDELGIWERVIDYGEVIDIFRSADNYSPFSFMYNTIGSLRGIISNHVRTSPDDPNVELYNDASGDASFAIGSGNTASGFTSSAFGDRTISSGSTAASFGYATEASGTSSFAIGWRSKATGNGSFAMGNSSEAQGHVSLAAGEGNIASGYASIALGYQSTADAIVSYAIGDRVRADAYGTFAIGYNSTSDENGNKDVFAFSNRAFVIGNGGIDGQLGYDDPSDAVTILFDGTTNIAGNVTAASFIGDGSGLNNLPLVIESITENGNTGIRLSSANADLYGDIGNNALDLTFSNTGTDVSSGATGDSSVALGENTTASGTFSTALGVGTQATGQGATALGSGNIASGNYSTVSGFETIASGENSTAMGYRSIASGKNSFAIGYGTASEGTIGTPYYRNEALEERSFVIGGRNKATGFKSFTLGNDNLAQGVGSSSIGENNISTGDYSMALGLFSESVAYGSFSFGNNAYADGYNTTAIGSANTVDDSAIADQWNQNNRAFVIGNGFYDIDNAQLTRSDAFTVWFNGDATLAGNLNINSDARLKANIISLGGTLAKLLQIDGKKYTIKRDESQKENIGVLAQDIEKVFPELVSESNGIKSVNYQGLVPVLINALKEQDVLMKEQQRILSEQQSELDELKSMMKKIIERK
jgi:cell division protein ZapA (FtsZ GTPase activity inhibitor)